MTAKKSLSEREGVNAVERIFLKELGWFFRNKPVLDWGIDAEVEIVEDDKPIGKLLALQIKSGSSYLKKRGGEFVYYGEKRHLEYWCRYNLPVYLILHDTETGLTLWQKIDPARCVEHKKGWSIKIPETNILNGNAKHFIEAGVPQNEEGYRRLRFALDIDTIERIGDGPVTVIWQDWVNKSLGLRDPKMFFGEYDHVLDDREADMEFPMCWMLGHDIALIMSLMMPWLEYLYAEAVEPDPEVEVHVLVGRLSKAAKAYLTAESYFKSGSDWRAPSEARLAHCVEDDDDEDLIAEQEEFVESMREFPETPDPPDESF